MHAGLSPALKSNAKEAGRQIMVMRYLFFWFAAFGNFCGMVYIYFASTYKAFQSLLMA
jgi:hypothetical protein